MINVNLYTDGACSRNGMEHASGGWCAILDYNGTRKKISGFESATTNNRMELTAVIEGVKALKKPCQITVHTDSQYVCSGVSNYREWMSRGWKTAKGSVPKNRDLWDQLVKVGLTGGHKLKFVHVEGHAGHEMNEACDKQARLEAKSRGSYVV